MWCVDCQQDVPAVARSASEPLVCPRCHLELSAVAAAPSDAGIALDTFDIAQAKAEQTLTPPTDWFEQDTTNQRLREIDRMLHSPYRRTEVTPRENNTWPEMPAPPVAAPPQSPLATRPSARVAKPTTFSWLLSMLLCCGVIGFCIGSGLLAWSAGFQLPQLWQHGMTLTIGAEGLLILSLTWMAIRLWRNGRQVNHQLDGVGQQLDQMQQLTGTLAGSQTASSQHFYHHFSQAASPHLLVANLRGQVEQLAGRVG